MSNVTADRTIDDVLLDQSVEQRQIFIQKMLGEAGALPEDPKEKALILKALDGIDKVALGRKRIKIEDRQAANAEKVAGLLAHVYKGVSINNNPYLKQDVADITPEMQGAIPTIPAHLAHVIPVAGETAVNPRQLSYKEFTEDNTLPPASQE